MTSSSISLVDRWWVDCSQTSSMKSAHWLPPEPSQYVMRRLSTTAQISSAPPGNHRRWRLQRSRCCGRQPAQAGAELAGRILGPGLPPLQPNSHSGRTIADIRGVPNKCNLQIGWVRAFRTSQLTLLVSVLVAGQRLDHQVSCFLHPDTQIMTRNLCTTAPGAERIPGPEHGDASFMYCTDGRQRPTAAGR